MKKGFAYFEEKFRAFLLENHPDLLINEEIDNTTIAAKGKELEEYYNHLREENLHIDTALELVHERMISGLKFSRYDTLLNILSEYYPEHYARLQQEKKLERFVSKMVVSCAPIFEKYAVSDDFVGSYNMETELLGSLAIELETKNA